MLLVAKSMLFAYSLFGDWQQKEALWQICHNL